MKERKREGKTLFGGAPTVLYLGVELASVVQEGHADLLQSADFTRIVLETLEYAAAHVTSIHQTVLDLS